MTRKRPVDLSGMDRRFFEEMSLEGRVELLCRARQDLYREMCRLHAEGMTISAIARALGVSRQKAERCLESGGPATHAKPAQPRLLDRWFGVLEQRWHEGCQNGTRLWRELRDQGAAVSVTTVKR
jgi:transposase